MLVDLRKQLVFPRKITTTDIIMWSMVEKRVHLIELTIPWEELAVECQEAGWRARVYPVEVGCQGFVGRTAVQLLHGAGVAGSNFWKAIKELVEEAEKASYWLQHWKKHFHLILSRILTLTFSTFPTFWGESNTAVHIFTNLVQCRGHF